MLRLNQFCLLLSLLILALSGFTQTKNADSSEFYTIAPGPEYNKPTSWQKLWGRNWRKDWIATVKVPVLYLDKMDGGVVPSKTNGGNETKGLKLKSASGKEYALRSINKARADVVPNEVKHTFIEDIIQDGVSMSQPYGAFALPVMEQQAGIYHTQPRLVYLPKQSALDTLNDEFGNDLYMIEQRLNGDWSEADNLGNFKEFFATDEVVKKLLENNHNKADQYTFVKARLFDMLLGDWDRHEDQWKWGEKKNGDRSVFMPIPRDRDQVFYKHDGFFIDKALVAIGNGYMQNFDYDTKNIGAINLEEINIDPFFTNEMTLDDWVNIARDLQRALTDDVIEQSIHQLPPEIVLLSGRELIEKLKSRRDQLIKYATEYYRVLAKNVEITGSAKSEHFEIADSDSGETSVKIFDIGQDKASKKPIYSRTFKSGETNSIRLYGIGGEDSYLVTGRHDDIKIGIIGGPGKDSLWQQGSGRIHVYDDRNNAFKTTRAKFHYSSDSAIHVFDYFDHHQNKKSFMPSISYNNEDRVYVGIAYNFTAYKWRKHPLATKQSIALRYSVSQNAFSVTYSALYPNLIGKKWNVVLLGNYDEIRWRNFFGLGNETALTAGNRDFFRIRTIEWYGSAGITRQFGKSTFAFSGFFQSAEIIADTGRYLAKNFIPLTNDAFEANTYSGGVINYTFLQLNDSIVPTKGVTFSASASYFANTSQQEFFQKYSGRMRAYLSLSNKFSLAIKVGGSTTLCKAGILNSAEYYEHTTIGGPETLRGYQLDRFWGQSAAYNNNELRFITKMRTRLLNAKIGVMVFWDNGRVWMPGENSNTIHTAYGGGLIFAPFYKIAATLTYGISNEARMFQVALNKLF